MIVDNLDRIDNSPKPSKRPQPEYLFVDRGEQLKPLKCHVVYTIPLVLMFSNDLGALRNRFGVNPKLLPMVRVQLRDGRLATAELERRGKEYEGTALLWNLKGQQLQKFKAHRSWVMSVSFSPDGQRLATAGADHDTRLWSLKGQLIAEFIGHQDKVRSVSFSRKGERLVTGAEDGTVRLWRVEGLDELLSRGCDWVRDYLKSNSNVTQSDRTLCDDIPTQK